MMSSEKSSNKNSRAGSPLRSIAGPLLVILGAVCMVYGIYRGEVDTVFIKAANICMECIGIG